jgi:cytochrome c peroxidase
MAAQRCRVVWALSALIVAGAVAAAQSHSDLPLGLDAYMPVPDDNPQTPAKIALGRRLFFDTRLSADGSVSCASCHDPARAFADAKRVSTGVLGRAGRRNAPALLNRGYGSAFFWDGRASTLEEQVLGPIENPTELGARVDDAVASLRGDAAYASAFGEVFGRQPSREDLARALASYLRSILAGDSPVDRFLAGDRTALSAQAQEGLRVFRGKGNCTACHLGPTFSDERFHNTGVAWQADVLKDEGRAAITRKAEERGAFKTPTLRHVADTAPYMHDGSLSRLEDVIDFYDRGGHPSPHLDPEIRPLRLTTEEKSALVLFLRSLSGRIVY